MYQKLFIIGNVGGRGASARVRDKVSFLVATNRRYKAPDGSPKLATTWFTCIVKGPLADICMKILKPGSLVFVEGRLIADDKTGGPRIFDPSHPTFEISADVVYALDGGRKVELSRDGSTTDLTYNNVEEQADCTSQGN